VSADVQGEVSGDADGAIPTISADGRYVAFDSFDGGYVANDINHAFDVFVRDTTTDATELISQADATAQSLTADGFSSVSANSLSADGRFVAFVSIAKDVVTNDTNDNQDVFVRDLQSGTNVLVSVNGAGTGVGNGFSGSPAISTDGRFVAFVSNAPDLAANNTNHIDNIYLRDLQSGETTLVSVATNGTTGGSAASSNPVISRDGRYVAFFSLAKNLSTNNFISNGRLFWRDMQSGAVVSVTTNGNAGTLASISADGRYVAYASYASVSRLGVWDSQLHSNIFSVSRTLQVSFSFVLSSDARYLVYHAAPADAIIAHDLSAGTDTIIGYSAVSGGPKAQISADGRFVTFVSATDAPNTIAGTNNVFLYDLQTATTTLVSFNRDRTGGGNGASDSPSISADGRFVTYRSAADDLVANDSNGQTDVFVFDRLTGSNTLVSVNQDGTASGNNFSSVPVISADGSVIAFRSLASDLITGDLNDNQDVFLWHTPIATFVDSDGDGMEDTWEKAYFGDLSHDGTADSDGDGVSDLMEFKTGTNPVETASKFSAQASVEAGGQRVVLTWEAAPGLSYRVEYKNDLSEANWMAISGSVRVSGSQAICLDDLVGESSQRFYRVLLVE
jgi:Tol biopolymer transport system component